MNSLMDCQIVICARIWRESEKALIASNGRDNAMEKAKHHQAKMSLRNILDRAEKLVPPT